jgi:dihydrofolate synthase/folylpolyglutamate synthase
MPTAKSKPARARSTKPRKTSSRRTSATGAKSTAGSITNYTTALKWLYEHTDHERMRLVKYDDKTFSLDRMRKLLDLLGNPHEQLKAVQVAGTKGKGSTCHMLGSMLEACGLTTGLYTSPHLVDLRERITINSSLISYNDAAEIFKQIASVEKKFGEIPPTFFEIMTAAALLHFAEQAVDVAILETGLGGRLDCVTAVTPLATGITQISLDHTQWLGPDIASIAREKAGIFKPGVPAFSVEQPPEAAAVLKEVAEQVGAPLKFNGKEIDFSYRFEASRELGPHTRVCLTSENSQFDHLAVPLRGEHQAHNCGLALALLDALKPHGFAMAEEDIIRGLAETKIAGRMEQVWSQPRVVIDGAHNAASIQALIRSLGAHINYDSLVVIFGTGQDKDVNGMLKELSLGADKLIFTKAKGNPRACEPSDLLTKFGLLSGKMAQSTDKLEDAVRLAGRAVSRDDLIVVTGSFYLVGEARKLFAEATAKRNRAS